MLPIHQPANLDAPGVRKKIARDILDDIEIWASKEFDDGHRWHLGASLIGEECIKKLWATYRWLKHEKHEPRMLRLFNRGHREEAAFIRMLRGIGFKVWEYHPEVLHFHPLSDSYFIEPVFNAGDGLVVDVTEDEWHVANAKRRGVAFKNVQNRVTACHGHFGGSLDGINHPPVKYGINEPLLCEFKTNSTGHGFEQLSKHGVRHAKPVHYAQMCIYGQDYGFRNALYLNVNKNDDTLYIEIVALDWDEAIDLHKKAERIVTSPYAPAKISESATYSKCQRCHLNGICFKNEQPEVNCRSCTFAVPVDGAEWRCNMYGQVIPRDFVRQGCPQWKSIV